LKRVCGETLITEKSRVNYLKQQLVRETRNFIYREKEQVKLNENTIRLLNPENVLKRGFTLTLKEGKIIKSAKQLHENDEIKTRFADGSVDSRVIKSKNNGNKKSNV
jgi:exodeoxyribonuclease VII large subunit